MADIRATQSGDFSATSTWVGGVVPGSGDVAFANTFTITISDTRTVQAISNASGTSITAGGTFSPLNGCNLTCTNVNGVVQGAPSATVPSVITTPSLGVGSSATLAASFEKIQANAAGVVATLTFSTSGTLNIVGNVTNTGTAQVPTILHSGTGTLNHTGNITGGSANNAFGISLTGAGTVNITGNITGGGATTGAGVSIGAASANVTVTGNVTGGSAGAAIVNNTTATLTVNGTCQSSAAAPAIAAGNVSQVTRLSGPFLLGATGNINPVQAQSWRWAPTLIPTYMQVSQSNGSTLRLLYSADNMPSGGYPVVGNVRQSTVYGPSSEFTGTLAVPAVSSVALGVAVDNTTGTAILTAANVRAAVGMASANLDTQLAAIPTTAAPGAATVASSVWSAATRTLTSGGGGSAPTAAEVATAVWSNATRTLTTTIPSAADIAIAVWGAATRTITSTIPAASDVASAVWSAVARTLTSGSAPAASDVASAVRTELSVELGRIDATVSSRLAPSGTLARVTLADTTTTLTNAPSVPSAATIASQVRTELTPELARLDVATSTRLAAASYSAAPTTAAIRTELSVELARLDVAVSTRLAPSGTLATVTTLTNAPTVPSAAAIASQVRTELTTELARIANCSTVDTTAATIQDAVSG